MVEPITLVGKLVLLEPLRPDHSDGLLAAASESPDLYRWTWTPADPDGARAYIQEAISNPTFIPFATVRREDGSVVGSTRFRLEFWDWPVGHPEHGRPTPDAVEIGWTWLAASALRSGINTEAKLLMLGHAFDTWHVHVVRLTTDARNERSRNAIERLGARLDGVIRAARNAADGTIRDSAFFSITAAEWPDVQRHLETLLRR